MERGARVWVWIGLVSCASDERDACPERCRGECVSPCPEWLARDAESCECEPRCGAGFEWVDGACAPVGGDADTDSDTDSDSDGWECTEDFDCCCSECGVDVCVDHLCGFQPVECRDGDHDGVSSGGEYCCGPFDCDDTNPEVPGDEMCNGIDDDCDGGVDEDGVCG